MVRGRELFLYILTVNFEMQNRDINISRDAAGYLAQPNPRI